MPVITRAECLPSEIVLEQPFAVELSIQTQIAGPITFQFSIDQSSPYYILDELVPVKSIVCRQSFDVAEEHTPRFVLQICRRHPTTISPTIKVTASGLDGTSNPVDLGLSIQ